MGNRVVKILMERDGMTKSEVINEIKYVRELMLEAVEAGEYWEAEDILVDELGLEPDYIFDIIM